MLSFNPTHIKRGSAVFIKERDSKLLVYITDKYFLMEEEAVSVEQQFHELDLASVHDVIVELSHVNIVSSHFVSWLVQVKARVEEKGGQLVLCSLSEHVQDILSHLHLTNFFLIAPDLVHAKQLISLGQPTQ